jgi:membrane protein
VTDNSAASPPLKPGKLTLILPKEHSFRVFLRVAADKFSRDDIKLRASALSYSSLASLVPIFAIILAVLSGPTFEKNRERYLDQISSVLIPAEPTIFDDPELFADRVGQQQDLKVQFERYIQPIAQKLGAVSIFGFLVLLVTVWLLFNAVENTFNIIWRATSRRPIFLRVAIATSMVFWGPIMLALSVSLSELLGGLPILGTYVVPGVFSALAFTAFYMVMPHAKVQYKAALIGGIAAALCWELAKLLFLLYVTRVVSYSAVYGSLGLIPMLFLWVYINWMIILYGAELAFVMQHAKAMLEDYHATQRGKHESAQREAALLVPPALVLAAAIEIARRFREKCPTGVSAHQLAQALHIEHSLARQAADRLVRAGILARVEGSGEDSKNEDAYLPSSQPGSCDVSSLLTVATTERMQVGQGDAVDRARALLATVSESSAARIGKMTLADLAELRPDVEKPTGSEISA